MRNPTFYLQDIEHITDNFKRTAYRERKSIPWNQKMVYQLQNVRFGAPTIVTVVVFVVVLDPIRVLCYFKTAECRNNIQGAINRILFIIN